MTEKENAISRIREFNRFYMPAMDLLGNHYLGSEYSVAEARVLFELYASGGCNATHIANTMNIDKSYLSRIIKKHEKNGYLTRTVSKKDSRSLDIHLTETGITRAEDFIQKSNQQIGEIIAPLSEKEAEELTTALDQITSILKKAAQEAPVPQQMKEDLE